jgi:hypothetical protein
MATDDSDDRKAKDVLQGELDPKTRAELERWFGLPSFDDLAAQGVTTPEQDIELTLRQERQQKALEAIDPAMLEWHRKRTDPPDDLIKFVPNLEVRVDPSIMLIDETMGLSSVAEPREIEIHESLRDDLKDCTPQALLRDLHRPEIDFDKTFEIVDMAAEQTLDIVAEVRSAMATNWKLPPMEGSPFRSSHALWVNFHRELRDPWGPLFAAQPLANRRWTPEEDR